MSWMRPTWRLATEIVPSEAIWTSDSFVPARDGHGRLEQVALLRREAAARVEAQRAVARQRGRAVGAADLEEAAALDREVERVAGLADRALREAAADRGRSRAGAALHVAGGVACT